MRNFGITDRTQSKSISASISGEGETSRTTVGHQWPGSRTSADTTRADSNVIPFLPSDRLSYLCDQANLAAASQRGSFLLGDGLSFALFFLVVSAPVWIVGAIVALYALFVAEPI